jgi:hypothetical protein
VLTELIVRVLSRQNALRLAVSSILLMPETALALGCA